MTKLEKTELSMIPIAGIVAVVIASDLPTQLSVGNALLVFSALLLLQSLIRDISILISSEKNQAPNGQKAMQCLCVESAIGMTGVLVGAGLLGLGITQPIQMDKIAWGISIAALVAVGFSIKDFVVQANPWRIFRDKDHLNIVFSWRK
jgi:hypothetical protein